MSVWRVESPEKICEAVLALATASKVERVDTMDVAWVEYDDVVGAGIESDDNIDGDTAIIDLKGKHSDLIVLDYLKLGSIGELIASTIHVKKWKRFTKAEVKAFILQALENGRFEIDDLHPKLAEDLKLSL